MLRYRKREISHFKRWGSTFSAEKMIRKYPVGAKVHDFEIKRVMPVPEFAMTAVELHHLKTGARHLHIDRDDKNNVFSISFKTNPPDKTGVPHILEHTTLCGSEKYPVRDPFFKMLNRSLSNFMNAMTGHDYTFFPFATTNATDFHNLTDVYLDSTLKPLLKESDFQQEGWRLENEVTDDKNSPLVFKGVVYNEMKGQVSNSSYYYWIKFQESIYPSLHNSGGDPQKITDLQYWDLIDFQALNYHPSNARVYTYGSFPLVSTLEKLNEVFVTFGKRGSSNIIKRPIILNESKSVVVEGPVDPMLLLDNQYKTSVTWYAGDPKDTYESFLLKILSTLLMDGHSAPFYQKLIESGVGTDFSVNSGMESMTSVNMFTVGLQGLTAENSKNLGSFVNKILQECSVEGFEKKRIEAIIHQLELSQKMESAEFGMNILYAITPLWVNDVDPFNLLSFDATLTRFRSDFEAKGDKVFTELIHKYLLDKPSFTFTMEPSPEFQEKLVLEELQRLESKTKDLDDQEKSMLFERGLELLKIQSEPEDLSSLPTLELRDIPLRGDSVDIKIDSSTDLSVYKRISSKCNGLTYFRAAKDITGAISKDLIPYLPLFTACLTNLGTHSKEMSELGEEIKLYTGGISASLNVSSSPYDLSKPVLSFVLSGVALNQNSTKMYELFSQILMETNFDNLPKLSTLIKTLNSDNLNSVISSGHSFAKSFSSSMFSERAAYDELLSGIKQVQFLSQVDRWNDENVLAEKVVPNLKKLQESLINNKEFRIFVTSGEESFKEQELLAANFIGNLPSKDISPIERPSFVSNGAVFNNYIKLPSQVQFSSLSLPGKPYTDKDGASLQVLAQLLTFKRLHKEIREKGGAYGGGSNYDALNGIFNFYSYRDPNPFKSLKQFEQCGEFIDTNISDSFDSIVEIGKTELSSDSIVQKDLDQAKLTIFQKIDAPMSVREEGLGHFLYGIDDNMRQDRRRNLLDVSLDDLKEAAQRYLGDQTVKSSCIIGNGQAFHVTDDWEVINLEDESKLE